MNVYNNRELKNCPFCNDGARIHAYVGGYYIICHHRYSCPIYTFTSTVYPSRKEAVEVWNTRKEAEDEA